MAKILLIDDDSDIRALGTKVLTHAGHEVTTANDALMGMDKLNSLPFDLVISDANMPDFSGFDLIRTIRRHKRFANLPIALLTARRERRDVEEALEIGVDDYIVKPIDPLLIINKVESLLARKNPTPIPIEALPKIESLLVETAIGAPAKIGMAARILTVSEQGITVSTKTKINIGDAIEIYADIFREMDIATPKFQVHWIEELENIGEQKIQLHFVGVKDGDIQKVRMWMIKQAVKQKLPAVS